MTELIADPFVQTGLVAVIGAIVTRLLLRKYPAWRLVLQLVFFAALSGLLLHHHIVPYEAAPDDTPIVERVFIAAAKVIWWINAAWLLTGSVRVFLILERQPRESRLIQDLAVGIVYLSALLSIVAYVFGAPVGTLIATSGVFAIILGLALQSTLADVFSGIALNLSSAYDVGDWIVLADGTQGRIVETNWRGTSLLSGSNDLIVLPNSVLAKTQLTNLSSPNRSHGVTLKVRIAPTTTPSAVAAVMRNVLLSSNSILAAPAPSVEIRSIDAQAIEIDLSFRVSDFAGTVSARNEIYDLVYRHVRAEGLRLAAPREAAAAVPAHAHEAVPAAPKSTALRLVQAMPLLTSLNEQEMAALAEAMVRKTYRKDEVLVEEGARLSSLVIMRSGVAVVTRRSEEGALELGRLAPGDFFGESGFFMGASQPGTVRALTFVVVYEIGQEALAQLMRDRPAITEEICVTLSRRAKMDKSALTVETDVSGASSISALVSRIRQLFEVPHA
ncbi:MAG TPA: mechanosensitive ion channel family protein [Reyranella sp.]|nr:mechanosensitive ion channel family protein [Reyranella sp.]